MGLSVGSLFPEYLLNIMIKFMLMGEGSDLCEKPQAVPIKKCS